MHPRSSRPPLAALTLATLLVLVAAAAPLGAQGTLRQLFCRGASLIALRVDQDPSPRDPASVVMVLEYNRPATPPKDVKLLAPGTCTWNAMGFGGVPVEPGRVRFDVKREAQPWSATGTRSMDTTALAGAFAPDPISLPRYLGDPAHYWSFFVDDATSFSSSFGPAFEQGRPTYVKITGPLVLANDARLELLCRGGSAGLRYGGGGSVGNNLAKLYLTYRVSATVPGPGGLGLSPGSCAWTDRTAAPREPGRISFITASNAQLKQTQSGSAVDRSPTAAERWPDAQSIPAYLLDPQHYWKFTVASSDPDSARAHGAWKRDLTNVVATGRSVTTPISRTGSSTVPGGGAFRPGAGNKSSAATSVFDIKNVQVKPFLENVTIRFEAAPNTTPTVTLTPASGGASISLAVGRPTPGPMWGFIATYPAKLTRNTQYTYVISAPATANARANQASGAFRTLGQYLGVTISQINILSDGDSDGNGELTFHFPSCPNRALNFELLGSLLSPLDWTEGPHRTDIELQSLTGDTPDQVRVVAWALEDDRPAIGGQDTNVPRFDCRTQFVVDPGRDPNFEWNDAVLDIDLTKYPGAKAGDSFVRRSKQLRNGSTVSFEIRGSFLVTRR